MYYIYVYVRVCIHILYYIILYYIILYYIILYYIILYRIVSYRIVSYRIVSYRIVSYRIVSYHIISYHIVSYHIMSCHVIYHDKNLTVLSYSEIALSDLFISSSFKFSIFSGILHLYLSYVHYSLYIISYLIMFVICPNLI